MDENLHAQALKIYRDICANLDAHKLAYHGEEERLKIVTGGLGDDFPILLCIDLDEQSQFVTVSSVLPFEVPKDKRMDVVLAMPEVNTILSDGCFNLELKTGQLYFRISSCFKGGTLGDEGISYMIHSCLRVVEDFDEKFFLLSDGKITLEEFCAFKVDE